jgi:hypothetical protein
MTGVTASLLQLAGVPTYINLEQLVMLAHIVLSRSVGDKLKTTSILGGSKEVLPKSDMLEPLV